MYGRIKNVVSETLTTAKSELTPAPTTAVTALNERH
jgi:hypothetical protein